MTDEIHKPSLNVSLVDTNGERITDKMTIDCKADTDAVEINQSSDIKRRGETIEIDLATEEMSEIRRKRHLLSYIRHTGGVKNASV